MKFLSVFDLRIRHPYYRDGRCPDFTVEPSAQTVASLKNHRSQLLPKTDGFQLVTTVASNGEPLIKYETGDRFEFRLQLANTGFPLFTDLARIHALDAPLYTNSELTPDDKTELELTSRTFRHNDTLEVMAPNTEEQFVLSGKPMQGLNANDFKITSSAPIHGVGAYDSAAKIITLDSHLASKGDRFLVEYRVQARGADKAFADIVIHTNATLPQLHQPSDTPRLFHIDFPVKRARWAYYCVTDPKHSAADLQIVDTTTNGSAELSFSEQNRVDLTDHPDPLDEVAKDLANRFPNSRRVRFLSDDPIPCRQTARKHLELQIKEDRLFGSLPNPSPRNYSTLQVKAGNSLEQQDSLYQLVEFLTH